MNRNIPQDEWNIRFPVGNQPVVLADYSNGIRTLVRKMPEIYAKVKKSADAPENDIPQGMFPYDRLLDQREIKKYDCINLIDGSGEENCNISGLGICIDEFLKRDCSVHVREYLPFLREGVIQHHFFYENTEENHHPVYLHFKVLEADPEEDRLKVELAVYEKRVHDVGFLFRQATTFIMDKGNIRAEHSFSGDDLVYIALGMPKTVLTFTDVPIARRMLRDYRFDAEEELKSAQEINGHMLNVFVGTFLHLNRLIEAQEHAESEPSPSAADTDQKLVRVTRKSKNNRRRKIVFLGGPVIECAENSAVKVHRGRIVRRTAAWSVRGHYRHYQSGKVIYIKPFEKGPERGNMRPAPKEYRAADSPSPGLGGSAQ